MGTNNIKSVIIIKLDNRNKDESIDLENLGHLNSFYIIGENSFENMGENKV